jgi:hypothetical protein
MTGKDQREEVHDMGLHLPPVIVLDTGTAAVVDLAAAALPPVGLAELAL